MVVNKWASWCGPVPGRVPGLPGRPRVEHGKEVAFVGLNSGDKDPAAKKFLSTRPLPFPSYTDPRTQDRAARARSRAGFPMTLFIDRDGKTVYTHTGPYTSEAQLTEDIERYLS